ncbi:MAG: C25 family cysteine peptidase, partial [Euryarchaeota archaeon]|nr:C25 family cysteine peptidase [Euryarchaeota archaeon]
SSWDPNSDGVFAAWGKPGVENDTGIDMYPDVALGRLACVSVTEVRTVVKKIITYETTTYGLEWFKKMTVISGDGFLDQKDLNIQWDTNALPTGIYTIYAQSSNPSAEYGPIETINITVDKTKETNLTFNHDDNLRIHSYPGLPMAEIVTVTEGNILGNTDYTYTPGENEAYCNEFYFWANMSYLSGVLTIRGKSYDPKPYGILSSIHVWIKNSADALVFEDWRNNTEMYYEGEDATGEQALLGRGGALYYMPADFQRNIIWASNGLFKGEQDVIDAWTEGAGFMFISGHGSPNVWADHYPGVPGNRAYGSITGLEVCTIRPYPPFFTLPLYPMDTIRNEEKLPIAVIGGCHNSMFNVSMVYGFLDGMIYLLPNFPKLSMWCYGTLVPETFSWRLVRNPHGGAIATMGNTGLGYGMPGIDLTTGGGDSWITIEFFKQYGTEGLDVLGQAYQQTLTNYVNTFDMTDLASGHPKSVQQWVLLGDPSLKIGGYE